MGKEMMLSNETFSTSEKKLKKIDQLNINK